MKLSILIPVYNERTVVERSLSLVLTAPLPESMERELVIVDDCSTDGTSAILDRLAASFPQIRLYRHEYNRGKGAAVRTAIEKATGDFSIIQDADLEYDPRDFLRMVDLIAQQNAEVIYGSRFLGASRTGMLWTHYLGNRGLTVLFNILFRQRLTDMETCYKLFRTSLLRQVGIDNDRFDIDPELTAKVIRAGHSIYEIPVSYVGRPYLAGKKIKPHDALTAVATLWRYRRWRPLVSADEARPAQVAR